MLEEEIEMKKTPVCMCLDQDLIQWLKLEAERQHSSMSQVIRRALVEMKARLEETK